MSDIKIGRDEVLNNFNTFTEQNTEIETNVKEFKAAADELSSSWEGEGKDKFEADMAELMPKFTELQAQMVEFCNFLQTTVQSYTENEEAVQGILNKYK